jgi:hypothetical protein
MTTTSIEINSIWLIYLFACSGIAFAGFCAHKALSVLPKAQSKKKKDDIENPNEDGVATVSEELIAKEECTEENVKKMIHISDLISEGSDVFLHTEYVYLLIFVFIMALLIFFTGEKRQWTVYTTMCFVCGSLTSMLCGYLGMKIAVKTNFRTTYSAL